MQSQAIRKKAFYLHAKVYFSVGIGLYLCKLIVTSKHLLVLSCIPMLLQILQIAYRQVNAKFDFYFGVIFLNCRLAILVKNYMTAAVSPGLPQQR